MIGTEYKKLSVAVIILSIINIFLICVLVICILTIESVYPRQLAPRDGVWTCEELCLQISFDESEAVWNKQGLPIACFVSTYTESADLDIYEAKEATSLVDGDTVFTPGEHLLELEIRKLSESYFVARDKSGNKYTFKRN